MNEEIIVAVYDTEAHAAAAVRELEAAHVLPEAISRHAGTESVSGSAVSDANSGRGQGFWSSLFGGESDYDTAVYNRSLESGSSVVTVRVRDEHADAVISILERHQPIDIDERAASLGLGANRTPAAATSTQHSRETALPNGGEEVIALSEEQLTVGKRLVNRGTTHIRRFVVETPVEENVRLHSERVSINRRPASVGARVDNADFTDRTIEVTETDEEAVSFTRKRRIASRQCATRCAVRMSKSSETTTRLAAPAAPPRRRRQRRGRRSERSQSIYPGCSCTSREARNLCPVKRGTYVQ
jgi:stress response protein YsnF